MPPVAYTVGWQALGMTEDEDMEGRLVRVLALDVEALARGQGIVGFAWAGDALPAAWCDAWQPAAACSSGSWVTVAAVLLAMVAVLTVGFRAARSSQRALVAVKHSRAMSTVSESGVAMPLDLTTAAKRRNPSEVPPLS